MLALVVVTLTGLATPSTSMGQSKNGFDLSGSLIPVDEILPGGPPRDGIPALKNPRFEAVADVDWLAPGDRLIALEIDGVTKAYPIRIMNWHEVVNDLVGQEPVAVTYCPLCGTGMVFDPHVADGILEFGVSGLLYNSDVLMYDRESESLWSQIERQAVTGARRGTKLELVPATHTTWGRWSEENPDGLVLSRDTGHRRDYDKDPYLSYASTPGTMFPVSSEDDRLAGKEMVLGIEHAEAAIAFPLASLAGLPMPIRTAVGEREILVYYFADSETAFATSLKGEQIPATLAFWFAWSAFHPETVVWEPGAVSGQSR